MKATLTRAGSQTIYRVSCARLGLDSIQIQKDHELNHLAGQVAIPKPLRNLEGQLSHRKTKFSEPDKKSWHVHSYHPKDGGGFSLLPSPPI